MGLEREREDMISGLTFLKRERKAQGSHLGIRPRLPAVARNQGADVPIPTPGAGWVSRARTGFVLVEFMGVREGECEKVSILVASKGGDQCRGRDGASAMNVRFGALGRKGQPKG